MQQTILITNQLATGSAFALLLESNENVFIPSKVMFGHGVRLGQRVQAIVVPNMTRPDRTPWLAVSILNAAVEPSVDLESLILEELAEEGRATVQEMQRSIGKPYDVVSAAMAQMSANGKLIRYIVFDLPEEDE
jgi:hypothetical protein